MTARSFSASLRMIAVSALPFIMAPAFAQQHGAHGGHDAKGDTREFVKLPEPMGTHMLTNMRDHLAALEEIQSAMARGEFGDAAKIAEGRLGMSSLGSHGASHVAQFMPQGMRDAGTGMHRAASRFAVTARDAEVAGDYKAAIGALSDITRQCVGCHAGYRTR